VDVSQVYDIGLVTPFTLRIFVDFSAALVDATDLSYPDRTDRTFPADTDRRVTSQSTYIAEYCLSDDNTAWGAWQVWTGLVDVSARYLQLRFTTVLDAVGVKYAYHKMTTIADVEEQEKIFKAAISENGTRFTFEDLGLRPMIMEYHVGVTVTGTAALYPVVEEEAQAFTVRCFDALGGLHAAATNIEVRGF
jgi:hypothetical protein